MHREESLISEYSNLQNIWETNLLSRIGNIVTINVSYLSGPERVESLIFTISSPAPQERRGRVREGSPDIFYFRRGIMDSDQIGTDLPEFESTLPSIRSIGGLLNTLRQLASGAEPTGAMRAALQETFRSAYTTLVEGDDLVLAQARIIGFADTLARMAVSFNTSRISSSAIPIRPHPLFPDTFPEGRIPHDMHLFRQGYLEGYGHADRYLREQFEQTRGVDEETGRLQPYASTFLLIYLRSTYGTSRSRIYRGLRDDYLPDINRLPSDLRTR